MLISPKSTKLPSPYIVCGGGSIKKVPGERKSIKRQ